MTERRPHVVAAVARMLEGGGLTPLSVPLPFYAYPFLAATLLGWAWVHRPLGGGHDGGTLR